MYKPTGRTSVRRAPSARRRTVRRKSRLIGKGAYGCVYEPSLECADGHTPSENTVSKLMRSREASTEVRESRLIDEIDPTFSFHLPTPYVCPVDPVSVEENREELRRCGKIGNTALHAPRDFSLLIMKHGGVTLEDFSKEVERWKKSAETTGKCMALLMDAPRLFSAVETLIKHQVVMHDIKPPNIVYNVETHRLNIIDFGLAITFDRIRKNAEQPSPYFTSTFHWSYAWELELLHRATYERLVPEEKFAQIFGAFDIRRLRSRQRGGGKDYTNSLYDFFDSVVDYSQDLGPQCAAYFQEYRTFLHETVKVSFDVFADKCSRSIDTYGLGLSLMNWLQSAKHLIPGELFAGAAAIFRRMITPNLFKRASIHDALAEYTALLKTHGGGQVGGRPLMDEDELRNMIQAYIKVNGKADVNEKVNAANSYKDIRKAIERENGIKIDIQQFRTIITQELERKSPPRSPRDNIDPKRRILDDLDQEEEPDTPQRSPERRYKPPPSNSVARRPALKQSSVPNSVLKSISRRVNFDQVLPAAETPVQAGPIDIPGQTPIYFPGPDDPPPQPTVRQRNTVKRIRSPDGSSPTSPAKKQSRRSPGSEERSPKKKSPPPAPVTEAEVRRIRIDAKFVDFDRSERSIALSNFQVEIATKFRHANLPRKPFESACKAPASGAAKLSYMQAFLKQYVTPRMPTDGILLWHSTGSGKTCTAVSIASTFEQEGYDILYVTGGSLGIDVAKNVWGKVICHSGNMEKDPADIATSWTGYPWGTGPITYKMFSNWLGAVDPKKESVGRFNQELFRRTTRNFEGERKTDPLYKRLIIIDEAQKLFSGELPPNERPDTALLRRLLQSSYDLKSEFADYPSAKIVLMTATPITKNAFEIMQMMNLMRHDKTPLPTTEAEFVREGYLDLENKQLNITKLASVFDGYISHLDLSNDRTQFAQKIPHVIRVPMSYAGSGSLSRKKPDKKVDLTNATWLNQCAVRFLPKPPPPPPMPKKPLHGLPPGQDPFSPLKPPGAPVKISPRSKSQKNRSPIKQDPVSKAPQPSKPGNDPFDLLRRGTNNPSKPGNDLLRRGTNNPSKPGNDPFDLLRQPPATHPKKPFTPMKGTSPFLVPKNRCVSPEEHAELMQQIAAYRREVQLTQQLLKVRPSSPKKRSFLPSWFTRRRRRGY